jgi:hypothetical protein
MVVYLSLSCLKLSDDFTYPCLPPYPEFHSRSCLYHGFGFDEIMYLVRGVYTLKFVGENWPSMTHTLHEAQIECYISSEKGKQLITQEFFYVA